MTVTRVNFGGNPYRELEGLYRDLIAVLDNYAGMLPVAAVIGVVRIIEDGLIQRTHSPP